MNTACLECHGPDRGPAKLEAEHLIAIYEGKVKLPEGYLRKAPVIPLEYGLGHPVEYHPVSDVMDPANQSKVKTPLSWPAASTRTWR